MQYTYLSNSWYKSSILTKHENQILFPCQKIMHVLAHDHVNNKSMFTYKPKPHLGVQGKEKFTLKNLDSGLPQLTTYNQRHIQNVL